MKDTIIKAKQKKIEIISFLACFLIANLANLYAIITYDDTSSSELFTSLGYVLILSLVLYVFWCIIRILFYATKRLFKAKS